MNTMITAEAAADAARAARVAAGGAYLDVREPGWLHRIDLAKLDLHSTCKCVLGQLATDKHDDIRRWSWLRICGMFGVGIWPDEPNRDYYLGFNAGYSGQELALLDEYAALTAEWARYIEQRRAAA